MLARSRFYLALDRANVVDVAERLAPSASELVERLNAVDDDERGAADPVARARMRAAVLAGAREPFRVGRYVVLERVGSGGMGVVYSAYDPELDRRVALKVLRGSSSERASNGDSRLLREAQALAKLTHPNVVTVHDVGACETEPAIFIAMEYVDGPTLTKWLAAQKRLLPEVLGTMIQAGRGLAAAHAAGIVHRDVKPDNVMLGRDGRVRVMDFGLAEATDAGPARTPAGTPAYMAVELLRGDESTPASDQFGFCVTMWEALYRRHPFVAGRLDRFADGSELVPPPPDARVPTWVRRVLERGLSDDPADRWPSMDALCDALTHGAGQRRRRIRAFIGAAAVLACFGTWIAIDFDRQRRRARCQSQADSIAEVWNDDARTQLRDDVHGVGVSFAQNAFEHATPFFDGYVAAWRQHYARLCIATEVDGARAPELWSASRDCLDDRRGELASVLWVLSRSSEPEALQEMVTMAAGLDRVEHCADDAWVAMHFTLEGTGVEGAREQLWQASALVSAGSYQRARDLAEQVLADVALVDSALRVRALYLAGDAAARLADDEQAVQLLTDSFESALVRADDLAAFEAASRLVYVVGHQQARHAEGEWWGRIARGLLGRMGDADELAAARLSSNLGVLYEVQGRYEEAEREHSRALAVWKDTVGVNHPYVAGAHNNLGIVYELQGRYDDAMREHERALAIRREVLGADHPDVANSHTNLADVFAAQGRHAEAVLEHMRALAIAEASVGADHPSVGAIRHGLGDLYQAQGRHTDAEREHSRVITIFENAAGPAHPYVALSLAYRADARVALGRTAEAAADAERSLRIFTERDSDALELARPRLALARALWADPAQRPRARGLARDAQAAYASAGPRYGAELADADRWLATHAD